jgi:MFS family permease
MAVWLATVVFVLSCLSSYQTSVLPLFGTGIKAYYGVDERALSLMLSIGMPASMVARYGARRVLRGAAWTLAGAGVLAAALGGRWGWMLLALALTSACYNALYVVSQTYLAELFPNRRRGVLSALTAALSVGGILFPIFGQKMLDWELESARLTFGHVLRGPQLLISLGMVVGGLVLHRRTFDTRGASVGASPWAMVGITPGSLPLLAATTLMIAADAMISLWLPQVLDTPGFRAELGRLKPGYVMALFLAAYLITRTALSFFPDRVGRWTLLALPALVVGEKPRA